MNQSAATFISNCLHCAVPENIHTNAKDGHWGGGGGGGGLISIAQVFKRKYEAKLKIPGGRRVQTKVPSLGEVWIFFGTTRYN